MSGSLPKHVESLVDIGIATGEASDRYLALKAANHEDAERYYMSQIGMAVVGIFMEQADLSLVPPTKEVKTQGWGDSLRRGEFLIRREVAQAIGDEIGVRSQFYELIGMSSDSKGSAAITEEGTVTHLNKYFSLFAPYICVQKYGYDTGRRNFLAAAKAIEGISGSESGLADISFTDTLSAIGNLAERPE